MFGRLAELAEMRRELDAAEAAWLEVVAAYDRSGDWRADGYLNAASAIRNACRMTQGVARGHLELARKLEALPVVAETFGRGEISARHATVVANAYAPGREAEISGVEAEVVEFAKLATPHELGAVMRRLTDAIDGDGGAAAEAAAHERRGCYVADAVTGTFDLKANSDGCSGAFIKAALDAEMKQDRQADDPRTAPQRRFDALTNICRRHLDHGDTGTSHGVRPHVSAVVDVEATPGASTDLAGLVRGDVRDGGLSAAMLELLLCDCDVSRVITAGRSEILDVGRSTDTVTAAQWKALVVRDRHCQHPGCNRPPSQCEAHHLWHWARGGPTNLDNLLLLCWHHHRERHIGEAKARARDG